MDHARRHEACPGCSSCSSGSQWCCWSRSQALRRNCTATAGEGSGSPEPVPYTCFCHSCSEVTSGNCFLCSPSLMLSSCNTCLQHSHKVQPIATELELDLLFGTSQRIILRMLNLAGCRCSNVRQVQPAWSQTQLAFAA